MKNTILLGTVLLCSPVALWAGKLSPDQALSRLNASKTIKSVAGISASRPTLNSTVGDLYIFDSEKGYMILPADDRAPALLGYSDKTKFDGENPELKYWLDFYNRELQSSISDDKATTPLKASNRPYRAPIAPLTKTLWNQEAPYNDMCPEEDGVRTVTGCVATAMAQAMKYHNYPAKGKGSHSYTWSGGNKTLSCDFANTTFEWDKMTDTYNASSSQEAKDAVATLMSACGISVDMNYGTSESAASSRLMAVSLIEYFDYDQGLWMPLRDYYGIYDWEDMIYADLAKGLPVLYAGEGTAGGHQFICDGYSADGYFHFNWGWGGLSDGYFLLSALNPANLGTGGGAGGFNSDQMAVLGMQPPVEGSKPVYIMYNMNDFATEQQQVEAGGTFICTGGFFNMSLTSLPSESYMGMKITPSAAGDPVFERSYSTADMPMDRGYSQSPITFPALEDGDYEITPAFYDGTKWEEMPTALGKVGKIGISVADGVATISAAAEPTVTVTNINLPSTIYIGKNFPLTFTVQNAESEEYIGTVMPAMLSESGGSIVAQSVYRPVDVVGNSDLDVADYIANFTQDPGQSFTAGNYILTFVDGNGNQVSEEVPVTVEEAPATTTVNVTDFKLATGTVTDKSDVEFTFTASCTEGYYASYFIIYIFPSTGGTSLTSQRSAVQYIYAGESKDVEVVMDLSSYPAGTYMAMPYNDSRQAMVENPIFFDLPDTATGVEDVSSDRDMTKTIYNIHGVPCSEPLSPGLYIINGHKTLIR